MEKLNENTRKDRMGLVQALMILHSLRDICAGGDNDLSEALDVVFEWIDNIVILLRKSGCSDNEPK